MGLFEGKKGVILGVFNDHSLAWAIAQQLLAGGAECGFSHMPDKPDDERQKNRTRVAKLATTAKFLCPMDVTKDEDITQFMAQTKEQFGKIDFLVHAIAFAPPADLVAGTLNTSREGFKTAMDISCYSLIAVCHAARELFNPDASVLTLTYYGGEKAVPGYNIMGVCKAALDCTVKYLSFDLGEDNVRVNAVSAGPAKTVSGKGAGVDKMMELYEKVAPIGRNITHEEVGKSSAFLLSDMASGITGEILHVDCGYNIMGSPGRAVENMKTGS